MINDSTRRLHKLFVFIAVVRSGLPDFYSTVIMANTSFATIKAEDNAIYSKFTIKGAMWNNPADHDEGTVTISFNANSDVAVPKFWSDDKALVLLYDGFNAGFDTFRGNIGAGKIFVKTGKGLTIKGNIYGGPPEGQNFVGSGTWIQS